MYCLYIHAHAQLSTCPKQDVDHMLTLKRQKAALLRGDVWNGIAYYISLFASYENLKQQVI